MDWLSFCMLIVAFVVALIITIDLPDTAYKAIVLGLLIYLYWKSLRGD